tara:strand:- start:5069 stop:5491 length:423 start_codon:yes stop_codon:yes gene_type:complete
METENSLFHWKKLEAKGDDNGSLVALESNLNIDFDIKRIYYIYGTKSKFIRGKHAHKNLRQLLICVSGSCKVLLDNGNEKEVIELSKPNEGIYINDLVWREMFDFSSDNVLLVIANNFYDEDDYIRDYEDFINLVKNANN